MTDGKHELVSVVEDLRQNIRWLEAIRESGRGQVYSQYRQLISKGINFIPYVGRSGLGFAPSKFIGYKTNAFDTHTRAERHGTDTTNSINDILGANPEKSKEMLENFRDFSRSLDIEPKDRGAFGVDRKFWPLMVLDAVAGNGGDISVLEDTGLSDTEKQVLILARRGQGRFRSDLMKYWGGKCCVTGCAEVALLRASHIRPWANCDNNDRLCKYNGLLLCVHLDALFDRGLISFDQSGKIIISNQVNGADLNAINIHSNLQVALVDQHQTYLQFHRDNVFRSDETMP